MTSQYIIATSEDGKLWNLEPVNRSELAVVLRDYMTTGKRVQFLERPAIMIKEIVLTEFRDGMWGEFIP